MYRIIIADDELKIRQGLSRYFPWNSIGFEVAIEAKNGRQVIEYLEKNNADVILCDIKMPNVSGIELAEYVYEHKINTRIVFLSAYREFEYAQSALKYGVKDYIIKPTDYDELKDVFCKLKVELDEVSNASCNNASKPDSVSQAPSEPEDGASFGYYDKIISLVKEYVSNEYKHATLNNAAEYVKFNPYYLSKLFKKVTNQNFSDYLLAVKMEKAAEMLKDVNNKCYHVGAGVGYTNPHNFSRAFKDFYGVSPREYRDNYNCLSDTDRMLKLPRTREK